MTSAEVRITPLARLLGRCLVYLRAGADSGDDTPVMVWRMKDGVEPLRRLMPSFRLPPPRPEPLTGRSLPAFLALPGILTAVVAVGWLSSLWRLPTASLPLGVGLLLCLGLVAAALEGFFLRGPSPRAGRPAHPVLHKAVHPVSGVHLFAPAQCPDVSNALQYAAGALPF